MGFYTYKNSKILLNGIPYFAQNVSISEAANIGPGYHLEDKDNFRYAAEDGIGGSLKISYLLTGLDTLANNITNEEDSISGYFGGLFFDEGYLRSYSVNLSPNNPTAVTADIVFFDTLKGTFSPNHEFAPELKCLNSADVKIGTMAGNTIGKINNLTDFSYDYSVDVGPGYKIGETIPSRVVFGPKQINVNISNDKIDSFVSVYGQKVMFRAALLHPEDQSIYQLYDCNGTLYQKEVSSSAGNIIKYQISIKQNNLSNFERPNQQTNPKPVIYSIYPNTGFYGTEVTINGKNLSSVTNIIYHGNVFDNSFQEISDGQIKSLVPVGATSGPITLISDGGSVETPIFYVGGLPIIIDSVSPLVGGAGDILQISGHNFYEISRVLFNAKKEAVFSKINNNLIQATVPVNSTWGYINVISDIFFLSGTSPEKFVPTPDILGFSPVSGFYGQSLLITGYSFSGVTGVKINNLPTGNTEVFTVTSNTRISVQVPSGNTKGLIRLYGQSGTSELSTNEFYPYSQITGIYPLSGHTGDLLTVSGINFIPEILYNLGSDRYAITFQGNVTGQFTRLNNILFTGLVPSGARSGIINICSQNLDQYPSDISFSVRRDKPTITSFSPISGKRLDYISVVGSNFADFYSFTITGINTGAALDTGDYFISNTENYLTFEIPSVTGGKYNFIIDSIEGAATGSGLYVLENPSVSGFYPTSGGAGHVITLSGLNVYPYLTQVWMDGTGNKTSIVTGSWNYNNNTVIFTIPNNISSGDHSIIIYNTVGSGSGSYPFKFIPGPNPSGFYPLTGQWNDSILLSGSYLDLVSSMSISDIGVTNYTITNTTGINFLIPENSSTDYIKLNNYGGYNYTQQKLSIVPPLAVFSGFIDQETYYGSNLVISGRYLSTVDEVHFSGTLTGYAIEITDFSTIGDSGINVSVPYGISGDSLIRLVNKAGYSYSPYILTLIDDPTITSISLLTGIFTDLVSIVGTNLDGATPYFRTLDDDFIIANNIASFLGIALLFYVPTGIVSGPISISGRNGNFIETDEDFVVLPTVFGVSGNTIYQTGQYITLTGFNVNTDNLVTSLGISGNNGFFYDIANPNEFSGIYQTGYSFINCRINSNFAGTGKVFLVSEYDSDIDNISYTNKVKTLFNTYPITISQPAPIISSFTPSGASPSGRFTINGGHLFSTLRVEFEVNDIIGTGTLVYTGNNQLQVVPPAMATGTGSFCVITPFGTACSGAFRVLSPLLISGYVPVAAHTGELVRISGLSLLLVTGVSFGDHDASFTKINEMGTTIISGIVPSSADCCGETNILICVKNESESYCL